VGQGDRSTARLDTGRDGRIRENRGGRRRARVALGGTLRSDALPRLEPIPKMSQGLAERDERAGEVEEAERR
jgi:hypothetical protein